MVVVSTRDFRTNQTKYLNMAKSGEHVVLKSRAGSFRIFPEDSKDTIDAPRDLMNELRNALTEVKEAIAGKRKLKSAESLINEL
jgi:antitoxin (DNA-binding transcriptional repressor) of toxin-antitoxin stability system